MKALGKGFLFQKSWIRPCCYIMSMLYEVLQILTKDLLPFDMCAYVLKKQFQAYVINRYCLMNDEPSLMYVYLFNPNVLLITNKE